MPFNPAQFVFQPRPLQQFDFGAGYRDLAEARLGRQRNVETERSNRATLGENQAQRADTNSLNAANFAKDRVNNEYEAANKRYLEGASIAERLLQARQGNDIPTVEALGPLLSQYGGTFNRKPVGNGTFDYDIVPPQQPNRGQLDVQGARQDIFGGGSPQVSQPFGMRSNVGPGGPALAERNPQGPPKNPFESLPGASAAAAGQTPSAPQSPQEATAPSAVNGQLPVDPQVAAAQNPMNPPAFQPMHQADIVARNRGQLEPMLQGIQGAAPASGINMGALNEGVLQSGRSPGDAFKNLYTPALNSLIKLENGQQMAGAAAGRLEQSRANAGTARDDKLRKEAETLAFRIVQNDDLKKIKTKLNAAHEALSLVDAAVMNPNAANALVTKMYNMNEDGLITNTDFTRTAQGMQSLAEAWKNGALNVLLLSPTGINPRKAADIKAVIGQATQNQQRVMKSAADRLYQLYKGARSEGERQVFGDNFRAFFPPEYYPPELAEPWEMQQPGGEQEQSAPAQAPTQAAPPPSNSLGTKPLPRTIDGKPKMSPNGVPLVPGRLGPAPPRKPQKAPTQEELQNASEDELMQMLKNAGGQ